MGLGLIGYDFYAVSLENLKGSHCSEPVKFRLPSMWFLEDFSLLMDKEVHWLPVRGIRNSHSLYTQAVPL